MDVSKNITTLAPIRESLKDYERLEERIKILLRDMIFHPMLEALDLSSNILTNAKQKPDALVDALYEGRVTYSRGSFRGRFGSSVSARLQSLGAKWDRSDSAWKIILSELPMDVRNAISASESVFKAKMERLDAKLAKILPEEIAEHFKGSAIFDSSISKTDRQFRASVKKLGVEPELPASRRKKIADEWENNMKLWIKSFTEKEIKELRADMKSAVFSGNRYESVVKKIQTSYGVTARKAKFLARQETSLLMTKFKESRYTDAGVKEYRWKCVSGSKLHPVRPWHKALEGKIYRWDTPPVTTKPGEPLRRNNPGQDFNCRCMALPIVRF